MTDVEILEAAVRLIEKEGGLSVGDTLNKLKEKEPKQCFVDGPYRPAPDCVLDTDCDEPSDSCFLTKGISSRHECDYWMTFSEARKRYS